MRTGLTTAAIAAILIAQAGSADPLGGEKTISFQDGEGNPFRIGQVVFTPGADGSAYRIDWADDAFSDHFLSMRPFRCLEGPDRHWCHVPYPYAINRVVTADDLTDLEYDLLFLHKGATEYGIDTWNGLYYRMRIEGDRIVGEVHEIDMGVLSAPPPDGDLRPVAGKDLHETDPDSHWLPRVVIE